MSPERLSRVEDAGLNASAAPQQLWLDGWLVRFNPGKAKRSRCINAVAAGRLPVEEKLRLARRIFDDAGLPLVVRLTPFSQPDGLAAQLDALGFARFDDTQVMVGPLTATGTAAHPLPHGCRFVSATAEAFAHEVGHLRGSPEAQRRAHAERLKASPVPYDGWLVQHDGRTVACGQIAREGDLVGLYDVFTAAEVRGQGLATALCRHLLGEGARAGATAAYLQVDAVNETARRIYRRLGLADAYAYHYRAQDAEAAA